MIPNSANYISDPHPLINLWRRIQIPNRLLGFWALGLMSLMPLVSLSQSAMAVSAGAILPIHYADPAAIEQALAQIYGDRLTVAQVDDQLILQATRDTDDSVVEAATALVTELDIPPRTLQITLSRSRPHAVGGSGGTVIEYQTGGATDSWHTQVESGALLILQRNRVETQVDAAGWGWASVGEHPVDNDHLQLQVFAKGDIARVIYEYRLQHDNRQQTAASTVTAPLGQWLQLLGEPDNATETGQVRRYATGDKDMNQLWLLVQ